MKHLLLILAIITLSILNVNAQQLNQTVRGTVIDKQSQNPLPGATVVLLESNPVKGTITDGEGQFTLSEISVGRISLSIQLLGYHTQTLQNIVVTRGKEIVLFIELEEKVFETAEVVVKAAKKGTPINELSVVSARSFSIEETERYAGSWGDPARMVASFAGVMKAGDQVNDIIIRGNSPAGLLWKLEGVHIANPNHFGGVGSTGGPVSMLNNNILANSDFVTAAFPANYGNATSGVFDLHLRNGNNKKTELVTQVGFNGFEIGVEGPFSKKSNASYLANYRYSTLGLLNAVGITFGTGTAIPYYQDLSYKINIPTKKAGKFTLFGLGGLSTIDFDYSKADSINAGTHFTSDMGCSGINHTISLTKAIRLTTTAAISGSRSTTDNYGYKFNNMVYAYGADWSNIKYTGGLDLVYKINTKNLINAGITVENYNVNYTDSTYLYKIDKFIKLVNTNGYFNLYQAFATYSYKPNKLLTIVSGVHIQQISLNSNISVEPRIGIRYNIAPNSTLSAGYGLHSQMQPYIVYFAKTLVDTTNLTYQSFNKEIDFTKSHHYLLGYEHRLSANAFIKIELYYQQLFNIPVEINPSWFSMLNYGKSFSFQSVSALENKGTGTNMGVELTFERYLYNGFYYMINSSFYDSKYIASDKKERNTAFNGQFSTNALGGYEIATGKNKNNTLAFDVRCSYAGGLYDIPIDLQKSIAEEQTVYDDSQAFTFKHSNFFRLDTRITFRMNKKKYTQEWALDIQNITNHINEFSEYYDPNTKKIEKSEQMGLFPMVLWRLNF